MSWTKLLTLRRVGVAAGLIAFSPTSGAAQQSDPQLSEQAPRDRPVLTAERCVWEALDRAMQPYIAQARASWPRARDRYLAGLPPRQSFFVTALLVDRDERREQVFIAVQSIKGGIITGKIWNRLEVVRGFRLGDRYTLREAELRDWLITKPDGDEEGTSSEDSWKPTSRRAVASTERESSHRAQAVARPK